MPLRRMILAYVLAFAATLALLSCGLWLYTRPARFAPGPASRLPGKTDHLLARANDFDLLYLGDSRTFCAFHPELLDPILGARSFNLAHWAHWLPTQYAQAKAVLERLPAGPAIVWSLGENNFTRLPIHDTYPIGLANAPALLAQGVTLAELSDNLLAFNPLTYLYAKRGAVWDNALAILSRPLRSAAPVPAASPGAAAEDQVQALAARPGVARYEVQAPEGRPVAVSLFMQGGGYLLEELDPGHFRARQTNAAPKAGPLPEYTPDPSRWATFLAMLDLFRRHNARLVVNVLEEAPHTYAPDAREHIRAFMDKAVRREVEARGFFYLRADLDQLQSADYFDYNHLNARGVEKYSRLFAAALAPHLKQLRGR